MARKIIVLALIFVAIVGMVSAEAEGDAKKYGNDHIGTNEAAGEVAAPGEAVAAPVAEPEDMPASLAAAKPSADSHHSGSPALQVSAFAGAAAASFAALLF